MKMNTLKTLMALHTCIVVLLSSNAFAQNQVEQKILLNQYTNSHRWMHDQGLTDVQIFSSCKNILESAAKDSTGDQYLLGLLLFDGKCTSYTDESAIAWITKAAKSGYSAAQHHLGKLYDDGARVNTDYQRASYWYWEAIKQDHWGSMFDLGLMNLKGKRSDLSNKEIAKLLTQAANNGYLKPVLKALKWGSRPHSLFVKESEVLNQMEKIISELGQLLAFNSTPIELYQLSKHYVNSYGFDRGMVELEDVLSSAVQMKFKLFLEPQYRMQSLAQKNLVSHTAQQSVTESRERHSPIANNGFKSSIDEPLSTFSIDVDTASYANLRKYLQQYDGLPPINAIRIEELINYFTYDYPQPEGDDPFSVTTEISAAPWNPQHQLVHIGLQGRELNLDKAPASNLVFLIDTSGSMGSDLVLVKQALKMLVDQLRDDDSISIVTYAGFAGLALPATKGSDKDTILRAIDNMNAGGSTAGGAGIELAYKIAKQNFIFDGNNRVILASDGDFNVGVSSTSGLTRLIESKRDERIFLSTLGFGYGNYVDETMEVLANKGNGNYHYIDNLLEAKKVLVKEMGGTLYTIAKDVKIQVEFNPEKVAAYRLIGYENRLLNKEDFNDDKKDAGELGAGHTVTALYEIIPVGVDTPAGDVDDLKYQTTSSTTTAKSSDEVMTVKLRYKEPTGNTSKLIEVLVKDVQVAFEESSDNFRFSSAVAAFGMLLRDSEYVGDMTVEEIQEIARNAKGEDLEGYRAEFVRLVELSGLLNQHE